MSTDARRAAITPEAGGWALAGSLMGISAGDVFLIFEMVVAGSAGSGTFGPLRTISATVLGRTTSREEGSE